MKKQPAKKRFAVGVRVRIIMPGVNGVVAQADDSPTVMAEYWHRIKTERGERREPGCNLELVPEPMGAPKPNMVTQAQLVEYFRSLEEALDEHRQKGTPAGDPVYEKIFEQLAADLAFLGVGKDQIEEFATSCGHGTTLARLEKLRKQPIGFSR